MEPKYIIALETGSSKIRAALGSVDANGILSVKAVEEEPLTDCVCYGRVRNVAQVAASVRTIIKRLQAREPNHRLTGVYLALGGRSTRSSEIRLQRNLPTEAEVTRAHIDQLTQEARATQIPDRDVIAVTPREFCVDHSKTTNPVGTFGREISAVYNIVSARSTLKKNLNRVLEGLQLHVHGFIVRALAEAELVLTPDEKRAGCMFVDFGAETTTVAIYKDGSLVYLETLPLGSRNITHDITSVCHLEERAEKYKLTVAGAGNGRPANVILEPGIDKDLAEINNLVSARAGEIIANILEQLKYAGLKPTDLPAGIVIVGGGAKLNGFNERLSIAAGMNVRSGLPVSDRLHISDSRIHTADAIDVIALLAAAAPSAIACMEPIQQAELPIEENDTDNDAEKEEPRLTTMGDMHKNRGAHAKGGAERRSGYFRSWIDKAGEKLTRLIQENEDLIDEENNK